MALVLKDRVKETSLTTGTGDITLAGATGAFQPFSVIGDGNTTYYAVAGQTTSEWEVGLGTYTLSTNTLSRDTVLASSSSGTLVDFSAGTKDIFVTYPSEKAVYLDSIDESNSAVTIGTTAVKLGETTDTLAGLESVEVTQDPVSALQLATKQYVDTLVASGIHFHQPVRVESPINLNATYDNGTAGVGATLTNAGTQEALVIDGITVSVADRVLVYEQTTQTQNGVYVVTDVGSVSTNWILTRASDADTYVIDSPNGLSEGSTFFVREGTTGAGETYTCNTSGVITFGTTNITFAQVSSAQIYSAGTGLTLAGTQFSISNTTVTPAAYGAASKTLTATVNAQGQLTALADTDISIPASYVTSGTIAVERGGTNIGSYAIGDLIYASGTTTLSKLSSPAVGNALISGGVGAAPSYGKIGLTTHVSGTLPVANGGTGVTSSTGTGSVVLSTSPTLVTPALGTPSSGDLANCTFPTLNQNTTGSAATLTTARTINGTSFNGSANITTANWGTARTLWGQSVNGSANITAPLLPAAGTVTDPAFSTSGDTNTGIYFPATDTIGFTTGGTQAATFDSTGNTNIIGGIGVRAGSPSANASAVLSYTLGHGNTTRYGVQNTLVIDNTTGNLTGDRTAYGTFTQVETTVQNSLAFSPNSVGVYSLVRSGTAAGNTLNGEGNMRGVESIVQHRTADATFTRMENAEGARLTVQSTGSTALIDNAFGVNVELRPTVSGATINTGYLFFGTNSTVTGTFTNRWGVYIASPINNYFNGGIQVGGTATGTTTSAGLGVNTAPTGAGNINASGNIVALGSIDCGTQFLGLATDSATAPSFSFTGDTNTGMFRPDTDQVALTTNGVARLTVTTAQFTGTLPWRGQNGTAAAPALSASGNTNTGIYFPAADTIGFSEGGVEAMRIDSAGDVIIGTLNLGTGTSTRALTVASNGYAVVNINGDYSNTSGEPGGSALTLAVDGTGINGLVSYINAAGNRGDSSATYTGTTSNSMLVGTTAGVLHLGASGAVRATISTTGVFQFDSGYGSVATAYGCRAWVNFNGTGTVAIRGSGNVSSITDNGVGDYTINFTTAMVDENYSFAGIARREDNLGPVTLSIRHQIGVPATTNLRIGLYLTNNVLHDSQFVGVQTFR